MDSPTAVATLYSTPPHPDGGGVLLQAGGRLHHFRRGLAGRHRFLVAGGNQLAVTGEDIHLRPQPLGLEFIQLVQGLFLDGEDMDIGVAALEGRVDPAAADHRQILPGVAVRLGPQKVFLQGVKIELAQLFGVVDVQLLQLLDEQGGDLVGVLEIQHVPAAHQVDGADPLLLDQAGVALKQGVVGVNDGVLFGDGVGAVVPVQDFQQPLIGGKGIRHAVDAIGKVVQGGADILGGKAQSLGVGVLLDPDGPGEQQRDDDQHGHKAGHQRHQHPAPQSGAPGLHFAPPCTARYSAGRTP